MTDLIFKKLIIVLILHAMTVTTVLIFNNIITDGTYWEISLVLQMFTHAAIIFLQVKTKFFENLILSYRGQENENL